MINDLAFPVQVLLSRERETIRYEIARNTRVSFTDARMMGTVM